MTRSVIFQREYMSGTILPTLVIDLFPDWKNRYVVITVGVQQKELPAWLHFFKTVYNEQGVTPGRWLKGDVIYLHVHVGDQGLQVLFWTQSTIPAFSSVC